MSNQSSGVWTPVDRHPRRAFLSLGAASLILIVIGVLVGAFAHRQQDATGALGERQQHAFQGAPAQFGANLDPYGQRHGGPLRISFVGASVTRGWYVTSLGRAYPAVASRMIARARRRDVDWHVVALPGAPVQVALGWSLPHDQDIVVIHLISDDFLYGTPIAAYQDHYRAMLAKVRKASPKAGFVCLGDWGRADAVNQEGATAYTYEKIVMTACHDYGGVYVPLSQDFQVPDAHGPVGHRSLFGPARGEFHPNDYGDQLIAGSVVAGIEGNPPIEAIPSGPGQPAPAPEVPLASPGAQTASIKGHESHTAPPVAPVVMPSRAPSPSPSTG